jgi:predicted deacylase
MSPPARPPLEIASALAAPGKVTPVEIPVARLPTGAWSSLPVAVVHGSRPGPTVWVSGAVHGDELNGVAVVREMLRRLNAKKLRGTVLAVPIVNVFGILQESRYLPDRRDLNRSFPGSRRGSLAGRLAHLFMEEIVERCTVGIDVHTGSGGRTNLPQVRCELTDDEARRLALAFGAPVVLHAERRSGSLRDTAAKRGRVALLYEAGEALRFDRRAIEIGATGVINVLEALDMVDAAPARVASPSPLVCARSHWLRAGQTGFCQLRVDLGQRVERGQTVAVIFDALGRVERKVKARENGMILGMLTNPLVHRGDAVANIGVEL